MFAITTWSFGISVALFIFGGAVCMNPAMVLAQCIVGLVPWSSCIPFMIADMLGGFVGAVIAWLMYADEFKASDGVVDPIAQRNIFSTNPTTEGTNYARNFFCEAICTFVFISAILAAAKDVYKRQSQPISLKIVYLCLLSELSVNCFNAKIAALAIKNIICLLYTSL